MLHELEITGFRCFQTFKVGDLGRLNVIVGKNNAGKTCLLEAIELLADGSLAPLGRALLTRGELVQPEPTENWPRWVEAGGVRILTNPDVRCAFHGHSSRLGSRFRIRSNGDRSEETRALEVRLDAEDPSNRAVASETEHARRLVPGSIEEALHYSLETPAQQETHVTTLGRDGGLPLARRSFSKIEPLPVRFIRTNLGSRSEIARLWAPLAATENEDRVIELLRVVEPDIERIAAAPGPVGDVFVRLRGRKERIPLGSFGEGTTRLFALACNLISVQHGLLLIDEIDTGLHVSTMVAMWRFLAHALQQFDVQLFATTHSDDCLRGLADFLRDNPDAGALTRLYRHERGAQTMVAYSSEQIVRTADANIEVR